MPALRSQLAVRLADANESHAGLVWDQRRRDPVSEHALLFFFAEPPSPALPDGLLRTAVRVLPAGDGMALPLLLQEMTVVAQQHEQDGNTAGKFIFGWREDRSPSAVYLGTGVSTIGSLTQSWAQLQNDAFTELQLPGRCYAVLDDGSCVLVDRHAGKQWGVADVWTSHRMSGRGSWHELPLHTDPDSPHVEAIHRLPDPSSRHRLTFHTDENLAFTDIYGPGDSAVWQWQHLFSLHRAMRKVTP
jgi:hypothetical protein